MFCKLEIYEFNVLQAKRDQNMDLIFWKMKSAQKT